nr:hypothetical protein [Tanacetum cinerariifolium]
DGWRRVPTTCDDSKPKLSCWRWDKVRATSDRGCKREPASTNFAVIYRC